MTILTLMLLLSFLETSITLTCGNIFRNCTITIKTVNTWTAQVSLQGCLEATDWNIFREATDNIHDYTETVSDYISWCTSVCVFPNQKPWFNGDIKQNIRKRREALKSGDQGEYKTARYELERSITAAKRAHSQKLESLYLNNNTGSMWQGIQAATNYWTTTTTPDTRDATLPDSLNNFYARFDRLNTDTPSKAPCDSMDTAFQVTHAQVLRPLKQPLTIQGTEVERADSHRFLGLQVTSDLSWSLNTAATVKKAQQRLYFIRLLRKSGLNQRPLTLAYSGLVESILTSGITVWYGNITQAERRSLQRIIKSAERIIGTTLPSMDSIYSQCCWRRAERIIRDSLHPAHPLLKHKQCKYSLRHSRADSLITHTRYLNSFFPATDANVSMALSLLLDIINKQQLAHPDGVFIVAGDFNQACLKTVLPKFIQHVKFATRGENTLDHVYSNIKHTGRGGSDHLCLSLTPISQLQDCFSRTLWDLFFSHNLQEHISDSLSWTTNTMATVKKAQQRLHFLRVLRRTNLEEKLLVTFYRATIESILTYGITAWHAGCSVEIQPID
ncbi:hypothetical protein N1851_013962 [Merluccius polli]|uniref:Alkylated DNA repair protein AlkB homologue 8 N-terminal domain-containing protein n=1 Tax=Merluccius polli TaxID=89951 RepID=A0AA47MV58_MERPO|nr:hypothetical protein N1851_013962 [Merluccius polli]